MQIFKNTIFIMILILCGTTICAGASKAGFINKLLRYSGDVSKYGKTVGRVSTKIRVEIITKYPLLAKAGDDLISGVYNIEKIAAKNASAGKMIENGVNPARVAATAIRSPKTIETGNNVSEMLAMAKIPSQKLAGLPPQAVTVLRKTGGNYREAGEMFLNMERKGGTKAVKIAEKLYEHASLGNIATTGALALLAWHIADPEGAEQAVEKFFSEHISPVISAPIKGLAGAARDVVEETLETVSDNSVPILKRFWPALLIVVFIYILWRTPQLRRMPFVILDNFLGRLNKKLSGSDLSMHNSNLRKEDQRKINVFRK